MFGRKTVQRLITEPARKTANIAVAALLIAIMAFMFAINGFGGTR